MSEPNLAHARHAVEQLEFLVSQDIFFNETNIYSDVLLPAASFAEKDGTFTNSDRHVPEDRGGCAGAGTRTAGLADPGRTGAGDAGEVGPPGGCPSWSYTGPAGIWEEMRQLTPDFGGIDYTRLAREDGVHWPCPTRITRARPTSSSTISPRAGQVLAGGLENGQRAAGRRVSVRAEHRPRAVSLAWGRDHTRVHAGPDVAGMHGRAAPEGCRAAGDRGRRVRGGEQPAGEHHCPAALVTGRSPARDGVCADAFRGGGGKCADR